MTVQIAGKDNLAECTNDNSCEAQNNELVPFLVEGKNIRSVEVGLGGRSGSTG